MEFFIQITNYSVPSNEDENAIYTIQITYKNSKTPKTWEITRNYKSFENLHKIFIKKYHKTPYLPCRLLLQLREQEKKARAKLMETYLNICIKRQEMLNSLELRLFLKIGENIGIFLNSPVLVKKVFFEIFPVAVFFFREKRELVVLGSETFEDGKGFKKIFESFSGFFGKKKSFLGSLFLMREKFKGGNDFRVEGKIDFEVLPTFLTADENTGVISVGFKTGKIELFEIKKNTFEKIFFFDSHQTQIKNMIIIEKNLILSSCAQNSLNINEFSKNTKTGFSKKITILKNLITTFFLIKKRKLLFLGDEKGNMHVYKILPKSENYLKLLFTQNLKQKKIINFFISKNEKYLYVSFSDKTIIVYDVGEDFSNKPSFVNIWENDFLNKKCFLSIFEKCFFNSFKNGIMAFCDSEKPENVFFHFLHDGEIFDFFVCQEKKVIFSVGKDCFLRISLFFELLNVEEFPKKRFVKEFNEDTEFYVLPDCENFVGNDKEKEFFVRKKVEKKEVLEKEDSESSSDEDDDLAGWA